MYFIDAVDYGILWHILRQQNTLSLTKLLKHAQRKTSQHSLRLYIKLKLIDVKCFLTNLEDEKVCPILRLLVDSNQASVVVFKTGITRTKKLKPNLDTSHVKSLSFFKFARKKCFKERFGNDLLGLLLF